jgi:hypothetical protein
MLRATEAGPPPAGGTSPSVGFRGSSFVSIAPDCASGDLTVRVTPAGRMKLQLLAEAAGGESPVTAVTVDGGVEGTLSVEGWNRYRRVVLVATNLSIVAGTFEYRTSVSGTYAPAATRPAPEAIVIAGPPLTLAVGAGAALRATADYGTCEDGRDVTAEVAWASSDEAVATVMAGSVVAVGPGTAFISATSGAVSSNRVEVTVPAVEEDGGGGCAVGGSRSSWLLMLLLAGLEARRLRRRRAVHEVPHPRH